MVTKAVAAPVKAKPQPAHKAPSRTWVPSRGDIIWIDCNPQTGREVHDLRDMHPMAVLSPKAFNARTGIVIGLPMTSSQSNEGNPFALDVSRGADARSFVLCHQPKSFDWRQRRARPHPWKRLSDSELADACDGLNDIIAIVAN